MVNQFKALLQQFNLPKFITILTIAIIVNIINLFHIFVGWVKTPLESVYLFTGHYYLDYFVYVQAIVQGIRGRWLHENPFASDDPSQTFLGWWQYVIYGKLGGFFHLSPVQIYWFMVIIYSIILTFLAFVIIRKLLEKESFIIHILTLLLFIFATPFYRLSSGVGKWQVIPYEFWYAQNNLYQRFGATPHHYLSTIIVGLELILLANIVEKVTKFRVAMFLILMIFLLTFSPMQVVNILSASALVTIFHLRKKKAPKLLFFFVATIFLIIPVAFMIKILHSQMGILARSSIADFVLNQKVPFVQFLLTAGPLIIFIPLGVKTFFSKLTSFKKIFFCFVLSNIIFFFSPLAYFLGSYNARFLSGLNYIFWASLAVLGVRRFPKGAIVLLAVFFIYFFPYHLNFVKSRMTDVNLFTTLSYIPKGVIEGFKYLDTQHDDKIVLTVPGISTGLLVPIFSDRKVYVGRPVFTPDYEKKAATAEKFYWEKMEENEARIFFKKNNLGFVVITSYEKLYDSYLGQLKYSFLDEVYKNSEIVIYKVM